MSSPELNEDGELELDGDRFDGLPYDDVLDSNGKPEQPVDIDDV